MAALISHTDPRAIVAHAQGRAIDAATFLAATRHMAARLPAQGHVLNLCTSRYQFAVVMAAALLRRLPMLLPSTVAPATLQHFAGQYPGLHAVIDQPMDTAGLPRIVCEAAMWPPARAWDPFDVPDIADAQVVAHVFTSGSTGQPVAHVKHWGSLVHDARTVGRRLGPHLGQEGAGLRGLAVTGTVPAQHMYGFETTILLPLHNQAVIDDSHPFYPADIASALQRTAAPRMLVITPFHLHALLASGVQVPDVALLLSATAPLSPQLASQAEQAFGAPLLEIYGSTETGVLATRRTTVGPLWQTCDGIVVQAHGGTAQEPCFAAHGGHLEGEVRLNDVLALQSSDTFVLLGRHADVVNIAGKRTSLAHLNHQLNSIPGVQDGALYWPASDAAQDPPVVQRPVAFVVAPTLSATELSQALRARIDPVFMPRPIHFVARLPRNATGKLPRQALADLAQSCRAASHE